MNQNILAIDLGTTTGWAISLCNGAVSFGSVNFKGKQVEGCGMRYLRFKRWLADTRMATGDIHAVFFEEVKRHIGTDAAHAYGGFMAHLTAWCELHNIPYQGVPVGTIKKHATGKGNAGKNDMILAALKKGHKVMDDNQADALALLDFALSTQL
jgi:Holliday junction resolvasome RuvABC endonuclease subunit